VRKLKERNHLKDKGIDGSIIFPGSKKNRLKGSGLEFCFVMAVHFGIKLYNDQRNANVLNLFIYLLLSYMFRDFFYPIFRGRCTTSAVVQDSLVWKEKRNSTNVSEDRNQN
jgi:hypothetical protein